MPFVLGLALLAVVVLLVEIARLRNELATAESTARSDRAYFDVKLEEAREKARLTERFWAERKPGAS